MLRVVRSNIRLIGCKKQFPLYKMEAAATISNATKMLGGRDDSGGSYSGYIMAIVITGAYLLLRYLDIRYIQKREIVGKDLFREGVILYISVICGSYIINELTPAMELTRRSPLVFTAEPEF
jgi:hypothetical protein